MKKLVLFTTFAVSIATCVGSVYAEAPLTPSKVQALIKPTLQSLDPNLKTWAGESLRKAGATLQSISTSAEDKKDAYEYKKEFSTVLRSFVADLQSAKYLSVNDSEKNAAENIILSYQKDMTEQVRKWMKLLAENDIRESGFSHVVVSSKDLTVKVDLENYRITQTRDMNHLEIDGTIKVTLTGAQVGKDTMLSIDGTMLFAGNDLYLTLRKYNFTGDKENFMIASFDETFTKLTGKTVHKKLDTPLTESLTDTKKYRQVANDILSILESDALLTPIAKGKDGFVMIFKKSTLTKILAAAGQKQVHLHDAKLIPELQLRLHENTLTLTGYEGDMLLVATLSRDTAGKSLFEANAFERGSYKNWKWNIKANSAYFAMAGAGDDYSITTEIQSSGAKAEVKQGNKTIAQATIQSTGWYAWAYDISATWNNIFSFSDQEEGETTFFRLWGSIRDEFGNFALTTPKPYEELDTVLQ